MRKRRAFPTDGSAVFHCMSHLISELGEFDDCEKEQFKSLMYKHAEFCGFDVLTYCVMGNHFHLLIRPQAEQDPTDTQIFHRVQTFYGESHKSSRMLENSLDGLGHISRDLKEKYLGRMGDVSTYLKELKGGFSKWYNFRHERTGPIWTKRFNSTTVENNLKPTLAIASYIDLNPVRAGIVGIPEDYRWSGLSAAVAGEERAQTGIGLMYQGKAWDEVEGEYRAKVYTTGGRTYQSGKSTMSDEAIEAVLKVEGQPSWQEKVKWKIRYFSEGMALGTEEFVEKIFAEYWKKESSKREKASIAVVDGIPEIEGLSVIKRMKEPILRN